MDKTTFPTAPDVQALERGAVLAPRFDANGLIAAIAQHADTGEILMFAWMNAEALAKTLELGEAVYFSRARNALWHKGDTSGQVQKVVTLTVLRDLVAEPDENVHASIVPSPLPVLSEAGSADVFFLNDDGVGI